MVVPKARVFDVDLADDPNPDFVLRPNRDFGKLLCNLPEIARNLLHLIAAPFGEAVAERADPLLNQRFGLAGKKLIGRKLIAQQLEQGQIDIETGRKQLQQIDQEIAYYDFQLRQLGVS